MPLLESYATGPRGYPQVEITPIDAASNNCHIHECQVTSTYRSRCGQVGRWHDYGGDRRTLRGAAGVQGGPAAGVRMRRGRRGPAGARGERARRGADAAVVAARAGWGR